MSIYISQEDAVSLDEELMSPTGCGFSVDQLMELAGQAVAVGVTRVVKAYPEVGKKPNYPDVLVLCGPGNNGGDGLVAARHLFHFGYTPVVCYPKRPQKPLFMGLVRQLEQLGIRFEDDPVVSDFRVVLDAVFGFSFSAAGGIRAPFDRLLKSVAEAGGEVKNTLVVSVDVPSGWDVNGGDVHGVGIVPTALISLTAPKPCSKHFNGMHMLGGRFVPPSLAAKYGLIIPPYVGEDVIQILE